MATEHTLNGEQEETQTISMWEIRARYEILTKVQGESYHLDTRLFHYCGIR